MWAKILTRLFAMFGMTLTCVACYGTMYTEFTPSLRRASGIVEDSEGNPIKGIKVSMVSQNCFTDESGRFYIQDGAALSDIVTFEDVDGQENGGEFMTRSIELDDDNIDEYGDMGVVILYREDEDISNQ